MKAVGWAQSFPISSGVQAGRRWARRHVEALERTREAPETVDDIELTVSEKSTNAHVHAHSGAQVMLAWDSRCLHVSVPDSGGGEPAAPAPDPDRASGRGLVLVDSLADSWETRQQTDGKTVTACFLPPGHPDPHTGGGKYGRSAARYRVTPGER
ncbi:ATP-binding protein [Streptomyces sp. H39-C1]|uniref:ATP-binding protein n=1 Tax=Streptomyces sp. H39-C1 TaxID=3004355 RepID=UPI0022AEE874|nr:ATP-binding protein [Streptomyces sp. H39-C1]MCZ4103485.1 ATP-binding protein [Streptomyces sp. H39-C1]